MHFGGWGARTGTVLPLHQSGCSVPGSSRRLTRFRGAGITLAGWLILTLVLDKLLQTLASQQEGGRLRCYEACAEESLSLTSASLSPSLNTVQSGIMSDVIIRILQAEIPPVKVLELTGDQLGGSDLASWRWNGLSLLHLAVDVKRGKLVKMLIEKGCDVNALDSSRWTPLTHACREGRLDIIKALVEQGAGVALAGAALVPVDSFTSLDVATQYGHMEILSYFHALAEKGGWLEWWYSGLRIVHVRAIENDHLHILKGIHAARSMKVTDPGFARSAIMSAIRLNRRAIAHYLLMDLQWDPRGLVEPHPELHVKEPAPYLCTLLHGAAMWCGDMDVMLALIWRGVDVNGPDSRGLVPLDYYVSDFRDEAALAFLMHCGAKWTSTRVYAEDLEALRREAGNVRVSGPNGVLHYLAFP